MISEFVCWLGFHDWLCLMRWRNEHSEMTGWACSRCNKQRWEQWDE